VGAGQDWLHFGVVPGQHARERQLEQLVGFERRLVVRRRQLRVCLSPRLPRERLPPAAQRFQHAHAPYVTAATSSSSSSSRQ
jgi:hypothetical protein